MTTSNGRRRAVVATCPTCRETLLVGPDADTCALTVKAEARDLTTTGRLLAVCDRRTVYCVDAQVRLFRLDHWQLGRPWPRVVAEHRCSAPIPSAWCVPAAPPARPVEQVAW